MSEENLDEIIIEQVEDKVDDKIIKKQIEEINVFTDGSYFKQKDNKNKTFASCGYGIFYPNKELPNVSRPFKKADPTNNRAELMAIYVALIQVKTNFDFNKLTIYSDSQYCIRSLTEYSKVWRVNGWKGATKKPVENQDLIKPIISILDKYTDKIIFIHVRAHTNKQDQISLSNDMVDKLAKYGAERSVPHYID
jgi:ribonuclease HI